MAKEYFKSSDISLISAACCYGYRIERMERLSSGKAIFFIEKDEKVDELVQKFFQHKLKVDALSFFNFLKEIKTQIYNVDR